jgi:hypothetical protein
MLKANFLFEDVYIFLVPCSDSPSQSMWGFLPQQVFKILAFPELFTLIILSFIHGHCSHQFSSVRKKEVPHIGHKCLIRGCLLHSDPISLLHAVG